MNTKKLAKLNRPSMGKTPKQIELFKIYAELGISRTARKLHEQVKNTPFGRSTQGCQEWIDRFQWDVLCEQIDQEVTKQVTAKLATRQATSIAGMQERVDRLLDGAFQSLEDLMEAGDGRLLLSQNPIADVDKLIGMALKLRQYSDKKVAESSGEVEAPVSLNIVQMVMQAAGGEAVNVRELANRLDDADPKALPEPVKTIDINLSPTPPASNRPREGKASNRKGAGRVRPRQDGE